MKIWQIFYSFTNRICLKCVLNVHSTITWINEKKQSLGRIIKYLLHNHHNMVVMFVQLFSTSFYIFIRIVCMYMMKPTYLWVCCIGFCIRLIQFTYHRVEILLIHLSDNSCWIIQDRKRAREGKKRKEWPSRNEDTNRMQENLSFMSSVRKLEITTTCGEIHLQCIWIQWVRRREWDEKDSK